jgi:hypothetical protein
MGAPHRDGISILPLDPKPSAFISRKVCFSLSAILAILALSAIPVDTPATMDEIFSTQLLA